MLNLKTATSDDLLNYAEKHDISVEEYRLPRTESLSACVNKKCYVGLDPGFTEPEKLVHLAHELGHCVRGAFYNIYAVRDYRQKHERKADEWAIRRLIPYPLLKKAIRHGSTEPWQIAEDFNVTCKFAEKAMKYWREKQC